MARAPTDREQLSERVFAIDEEMDGSIKSFQGDANNQSAEDISPFLDSDDLKEDDENSQQDSANSLNDDNEIEQLAVFESNFIDSQFELEDQTWYERNILNNKGNAALLGLYLLFGLTVSFVIFYALFGYIPTLEEQLSGRPSAYIDPARIEIQREAGTKNQAEKSKAKAEPSGGAAARASSQRALGNSSAALSADNMPASGRTSIQLQVEMEYGRTEETLSLTSAPPDPYAGKLAKAPIHQISNIIEGDTVLPVRSSAGLMPMSLYARPSELKPGFLPVSIIMINLGLNRKMNELALKLPGEVTLAYAPQGRYTKKNAVQAREHGHETAVYLPIQPFDFPLSDAGPNSIMLNIEVKENLSRLHWALSRTVGYASLVVDSGGAFSNDPNTFEPVFRDLTRRGLIIINMDGVETPFFERARQRRIKVLHVDDKITEALNRTSFLQKLLFIETEAQTKGSLVVAIAAFPNNVPRIREWSDQLAKRRLQLIPATAMVKYREELERKQIQGR